MDPRWVALFLGARVDGCRYGACEYQGCGRTRLATRCGNPRVRTLVMADRLLRVDFIAMLRGLCPEIDDALPGSALPDLARLVIVGDDVPAAAIGWDAMVAGAVAAEPCCEPGDTLLIPIHVWHDRLSKGCAAGASIHVRKRLRLRRGGWACGSATAFTAHGRFFMWRAAPSLSWPACNMRQTLVTMERFEPGEALMLMERERCTPFSPATTPWR